MITVEVRGRVATKTTADIVTSGSVGQKVKFIFSGEGWDGLNKLVSFSSRDNVDQVLDDAGEAVIPWECVEKPGKPLLVGIYGTNANGEVVVPTIYCNLGMIRKGVELNPSTAHKATEVVAQMLEIVTESKHLAANAEQDSAEAAEKAIEAANAAKDAATSAMQSEIAANIAKNAATSAQTSANTAAIQAENAARDAATAQAASQAAKEDADRAAAQARNASAKATEAAESAAEAAQNAGNAESKASAAAQSASLSASAAAQSASDARTAQSAASQSAGSAQSAQQSAQTAQGEVSKAQQAAQAAKSDADKAAAQAQTAGTKATEAAASAAAAATSAAQAVEAVGGFSGEINAINNRIDHVDEVIIKTVEPLQKQADDTERSLDALWKLNRGQTYDIEQRNESGMNGAPTGAKFMSLEEVEGKTEQASTNGYQLLKFAEVSKTNNGITVEIAGDSVKIKGTATALSLTQLRLANVLPVDTYCMSANNSQINLNVSIRLYGGGSSDSVTDTQFASVNVTKTFTTTKEIDTFTVRVGEGTTVDMVIKPMIEKGSAAHDWEPYTGGIPSPSPDYPQEIVSVDSFEVKVQGKNLAKNYGNGGLNALIGAVFPQKLSPSQDSSVTQHIITDAIGKGTYTLSANDSRIQYFVIYSDDGATVSRTQGWNGMTIPIVVDKYAQVMVKLRDETAFKFSDFDIQLEYGITFTSYEPYAEPTVRTITPPRPLNAIGDSVDAAKVDVGVWEYRNLAENVRAAIDDGGGTSAGGLKWSSLAFSANTYIDAQRFGEIKCDKFTVVKGITSLDSIANRGWSSKTPIFAVAQGIFRIYGEPGTYDIKLVSPLESPATEPIDPDDLAFLRNLELLPAVKHITVTDNHGRDVPYLLEYITKLSEVVS